MTYFREALYVGLALWGLETWRIARVSMRQASAAGLILHFRWVLLTFLLAATWPYWAAVSLGLMIRGRCLDRDERHADSERLAGAAVRSGL